MRFVSIVVILSAVLLAQPAGAETGAAAADSRQTFVDAICAAIEARAVEYSLPDAFLTRLIWQESMFDPQAVSPVGAQGIAQFMPGTARFRGLADPFDSETALAASASYLANLRDTFGNLGLAAAAYNAGEQRVRDWLAGDGGLPAETQDYVLAVTGRSHDDWKDAGASYPIPSIGAGGSFTEQCRALALRQVPLQQIATPQGPRKPWGVVLAGGFSEARALATFRSVRARYAQLLKDELPMLSRKRNLSMGRIRVVRVAVGRDSRAEAQSLCQQITAAGGACLVERY